jgi:phosphoglycerol transferase
MFFESEIYGLKIIQMLLPVPGHFVGKLSSLSERYLALSPYISENRMSSLGLVAAFGFFIMTAWGLLRPKFTSKPFSDQSKRRISLLDQLSSLNMFSVLIATIGGFGTLIAFLFFPSIRAYNRISIYIAFFSLAFLIALILELFSKFRSRWVQFAKVFLLISLLVFGVWDQTGKIGTDATTGIRSFASDKRRNLFFS